MLTNRIRVIVDTNLWISSLIGRQLTLLELAIQAKAVYLVSGDSDLLEMGSIGDCRIMTVRQFEQEIWGQI